MRFEEQILSKDRHLSRHIFAPNGGYCVYHRSNIFATRAVLKIGEYLVNKPLQAAGMSADMSAAERLSEK